MHNRDQLKERAAKAIDKKGMIGVDINLDEFDDALVPHSYLADEDLCALPMADQQQLIMAGLDVTKKDRGGTYFQKDTAVVHCHSQQEGIDVIPIQRALDEYDWIGDYYWPILEANQSIPFKHASIWIRMDYSRMCTTSLSPKRIQSFILSLVAPLHPI